MPSGLYSGGWSRAWKPAPKKTAAPKPAATTPSRPATPAGIDFSQIANLGPSPIDTSIYPTGDPNSGIRRNSAPMYTGKGPDGVGKDLGNPEGDFGISVEKPKTMEEKFRYMPFMFGKGGPRAGGGGFSDRPGNSANMPRFGSGSFNRGLLAPSMLDEKLKRRREFNPQQPGTTQNRLLARYLGGSQ